MSRPETLAAATVVIGGRKFSTAVSVYAPWERPLGSEVPLGADASAPHSLDAPPWPHRLLSDALPLRTLRARARTISKRQMQG